MNWHMKPLLYQLGSDFFFFLMSLHFSEGIGTPKKCVLFNTKSFIDSVSCCAITASGCFIPTQPLESKSNKERLTLPWRANQCGSSPGTSQSVCLCAYVSGRVVWVCGKGLHKIPLQKRKIIGEKEMKRRETSSKVMLLQ